MNLNIKLESEVVETEVKPDGTVFITISVKFIPEIGSGSSEGVKVITGNDKEEAPAARVPPQPLIEAPVTAGTPRKSPPGTDFTKNDDPDETWGY